MKWFMGGACLIICVVMGVVYYRRSWRRVQFYTEVINFCHHLQTALGFTRPPLPLVIKQALPQATGEFAKALAGYGQLLDGQSALTREKCTALTTDTDVAEFLFQLGRTGSVTEQAKIANALTIFTAKQQQANDHLRFKASITLKLLIIIGIAGVILWI